MLVLFTDSDCDISPDIAKYYGFELISMPYTINEKEIYPYVDFEEFKVKEYYDQLRKGTLPTTSALSPLKYIEYFEPHFAAGNDILYVHFSKAMSGTFNSLNLALQELKEKYPERNFYTIDTKAITALSYLVVTEIGRLVKQGKTIDELLAWANTEVDKYAIYFYADDLTFFKRSGRVSGFSGVMGNLLGIHPIIHMSSEGKMVNLAKARGKRNSLNKIIDMVSEIEEDIANYPVIIAHSDCLEIAHELEKLMKERFGENLKTEYVVVNPTAGAHCGPNCVGVAFHAKHR